MKGVSAEDSTKKPFNPSANTLSNIVSHKPHYSPSTHVQQTAQTCKNAANLV